MAGKRWTEEEDDTLHEFYQEEGAALCAEVLDRTVASVHNRASRLNITKSNLWTTKEENTLIKLYSIKGVQHCSKLLNKTEQAIYVKANRLNITSSTGSGKHKTHKQYEYQIPKDYVVLETYIDNKTELLHKHTICDHEWLITPNNILMGHKCPKCANLKTHEQYKRELPKAYTVLETYINSKTKILHRHKVCGYEWSTRPSNILQGSGCPVCQHINSNFLYFIYFPELDLYKIGITSSFKRRSKQFGYIPEIISLKRYESGKEAYIEEQHILKELDPYLVNTGKLWSGNTETLRFS